MERTKRFKKSEWLGRLCHRKWMAFCGWQVVKEEETQAYNGKKGLLLGLLFLPLALLGGSKYIDVTYRKN